MMCGVDEVVAELIWHGCEGTPVKKNPTALKHTCSVKLSQGNKCENHTTASYLAPKVGKLQCCRTGGISGRWMYAVREEHWRLAKCLLNSSQVLGARVCLCMCADGWTPNPNCHILFPAKHLAAAQDNWPVSAEVIMVSINSSNQGLTPRALHPALVYFHSRPLCGISLTTANTNVMHFQSGRDSALICHLETTIALLKLFLQSAFQSFLLPDWIPPLRDAWQCYHILLIIENNYLQVRTCGALYTCSYACYSQQK